ncbi:MAG: hypothetical protein DRN12_07265 [Thermoplasmata archaeon]|nr:MAG: hypothetical protein DRN12_07265 [Thermoplasmata archaeon]
MDEMIRIYGENAGKIWHALNSNGPLTKHQILHQTNLNEKEFYIAIGWLARENKIRRDGEFYSLADQTNLIYKIGTDAGKLVNILKNLRNDITQIAHLTDMEEKDIYAALGWLARENKIEEIQQTLPNSIDLEEKVEFLNQEIEDLNDEINIRDQIVYELSRQLTEMEMQTMLQADIIEHLSVSKPADLAAEVKSLHEELELRNRIIHELTQQLTETQREKIGHMVTEHIRTNILRNLSNIHVTDMDMETKSSDMLDTTLLENPVLHIQKNIESTIKDTTQFHPFEESFNEQHPMHVKKTMMDDKQE